MACPGDKRLKTGDIVNIDITVIKDGFHGDTSRMFYVGEPSIHARRLCEITYQCMWLGIARCVRVPTWAISATQSSRMQKSMDSASCASSAVTASDARFHEEPQVLHYGRPQTGLRLQPGMIFTVEPMINAGKRRHPSAGRRLDHRHQGSQPVGTMGAHGAGYRIGLRGVDGLRRHARTGRLAASVASKWTMPVAEPGIVAANPWTPSAAQARRLRKAARSCEPRFTNNPSPGATAATRTALGGPCLKSVWTRHRCRRVYACSQSAAMVADSCFPILTSTCCSCLPDDLKEDDKEQGLRTGRQCSGTSACEIGHSARTSTQCVSEAAQDITVETNLLEARYLDRQACFGARVFRARSHATLDQSVLRGEAGRAAATAWAVRRTADNLEPNVKESPGGLRDLANIIWIAVRMRLGAQLGRARTARHHHHRRGAAPRAQRAHAAGSAHPPALPGRPPRRSTAVRHADPLAQQFGLQDTKAKRASEQLMQSYYRTARGVTLMNEIILSNLRSQVFPRIGQRPVQLNATFRGAQRAARGAPIPRCTNASLGAILETFRLLQEHRELKGIGATTLRALWRDAKRIDASSATIRPTARRS